MAFLTLYTFAVVTVTMILAAISSEADLSRYSHSLRPAFRSNKK